MSILTAQLVRSRIWMKCPRCDGGAAFTDRDRSQGTFCTYCDNNREIPRRPCRARNDHLDDGSSYYERIAGA